MYTYIKSYTAYFKYLTILFVHFISIKMGGTMNKNKTKLVVSYPFLKGEAGRLCSRVLQLRTELRFEVSSDSKACVFPTST